jgi:hypothetical protein
MQLSFPQVAACALVLCVASPTGETKRGEQHIAKWGYGSEVRASRFSASRSFGPQTCAERTDGMGQNRVPGLRATAAGSFVPLHSQLRNPHKQGELGLILQAPINVNVASAKAHRSRPSPLTVAYTVSKSGPAGPQLFAGPSSLYIAVGLDGNRARFNGVSYSLVRQERNEARPLLLDPMSY